MNSLLKKPLNYAVLALGLFMASCSTDLYRPEDEKPIIDPEEGGSVPKDFTWSLTKETRLSVNIENPGDEKYIVAAYIGNPAIDPDARMIANSLQRVSKDLAYERTISIPEGVPTLFLSVTDSRKRAVVYGFEVTEGNMVCTVGGTGVATKARSEMAGAEMPEVNYTYEGTAYEEISGSGKVVLNSGMNYVIPKGRTFNGQVSLPGTGNFNVFVEGTWDLTGQQLRFETGANLYVLRGGEVKTSRKGAKITLTNGNSRVAVQKGGEFGDDDDRLIDFYLTNNTAIVNEGDMEAGIVQMDSQASVYNAGEFDAKSVSMQNEGNYILNKHELEADLIQMTNGTIDNYCKLDVDKITAKAGMAYINLAPAAYADVDELQGDHVRIFLDAKSFWDGDKASFTGWDNRVEGGSTDYALFKVKEIKVSTRVGKLLNYAGMVNIECKKHTQAPDAYNPCYGLTAPANFSIGQGFVEIDEDDCNNHNGNHNPGEDPDPDGDGDITETNTLPSTYLFEDNWPEKGDYDMNDVVLSATIANTIAADGKVKAVDVNVKLYAVGATKKLGVAFQLNGVPSGAVAGSEAGQQYAVVRLFDDAHAALGAPAGLIANTYTFDATLVKEFQRHIDFAVPLENGISESNFNLFIVWGGMDTDKRNEIHIAGFRGTDKANTNSSSTELYTTTADGLMWGLRIPQLNFASFPKEGAHISKAYSGFGAWMKENGLPDWYLHPVEGNVITLEGEPSEEPAE